MVEFKQDMNIEIRKATAEESDLIADFQRKMAIETESKQLDRDTVAAGVRRVFEDPGRGFYILAVDNDIPIGSLLITFEWSDWRNTQMWYIQSVYLLPEFRGQKIFSRMFDHVKFLANQTGVKVIRLYVETENRHAQSVYENLGMSKMPYWMYDIELDQE